MSTTSLWEDGQLPGLSGPKQVGAGLRLVRANLLPILAIWVALTLYSGGQTYLARTLGVVAAPTFSARYLGFTLLSGVVSAVLSALTFRVLLGRRATLDGSALVGLGIFVLIAVLPALILKLAVGQMPTDTGDTQAMMAMGLRSLGASFAILVAALIWLKLLLWPIGLVVGDTELTPSVSWKLTHRAYWGYIIGCILLGAIPYIIMLVIIMGARAGAPATPATAANVPLAAAPFTALFALAFSVTAAGLFHLRRSGELDPAEAFD